MNEIILLKLGELVPSRAWNRRSFEDKLQANIHRRLHPYGQFRVYTRQSATYVEPKDDSCDVRGAYEALTKVFGIAGCPWPAPARRTRTPSWPVPGTFLDEAAPTARTFKVETKRADKSFPMTSIQLKPVRGRRAPRGAYGDNLKVDVHHPELTVYIEVRDYAAWSSRPAPARGGRPAWGINGRAVTLLSGGIDCPVASWMIAKRGWPWWCAFLLPTPPRGQGEGAGAGPPVSPPTRAALTVPYVVPFTAIQGGARLCAPRSCSPSSCAAFMMRIPQPVGQAVRRQGPRHRRVPGTGGQPDRRRPLGHHRLRGGPCPSSRPCIGMDTRREICSDRPEDRHLLRPPSSP